MARIGRWLTYRHPDGRAVGVVVIESHGILHARLKAALAGADRDLEFVLGHKLDQDSTRKIASCICPWARRCRGANINSD